MTRRKSEVLSRLLEARPGTVVLGLWLMAVVLGVGALGQYQSRPGTEGAIPLTWKEAGTTGATAGSRAPRLQVFLHPHCPCSTATIEQLQRVLAAADERRLDLQVHVYRPAHRGEEFLETSLVESAARIPRAEILVDIDGAMARRFGARTSGTIRLYAGDGRLLFAGGVTASRGHEGDCRGSEDLLAMIRGAEGPARHAPVYGCSLFPDEGL